MSGASANGYTDWEAYARLRLWGWYDTQPNDDDNPLTPMEAETEVEFFLRSTSSSLLFNYPPPRKWCEGIEPGLIWRDCWLENEYNTETRKVVGTYSHFFFNGIPQMDWDQHATYNARLSGNDTYRCYAGPHPGSLNWSCRGNRTSSWNPTAGS